jgi:hypothetical protein
MEEYKDINEYIRNRKLRMVGKILFGGGFFSLIIYFWYFVFSADLFFYLLLITLIIAFILGWRGTKGDFLAQIWKIACPKCEQHIELNNWVCPCGKKISGKHILEGCPYCGTKYGKSHTNIRSIVCPSCRYELSFLEPYEFYNWSILGKDETTEEFKLVPRTNILDYLGDTICPVVLGIVVVYTLFSYPEFGSAPSRLRVLFAFLGVVTLVGFWLFPWIGKKLFPPKKLVRNPKYKEGAHG